MRPVAALAMAAFPAALVSAGGAVPALGRLEALSGTLDNVARRLAEVAASGQRTRRLAIGLAVSFILDILLTIAVTLLTLSARHADVTIRASQLASCVLSNQARAEQRDLWGYLIELSEKGPQTPASKTELEEIQAFIGKTFAPEDCAELYPG